MYAGSRIVVHYMSVDVITFNARLLDAVESIVRRRTLAAFFARCPNFEPPAEAGQGAVPVVDLAPMPMPRRPINF